MTTKTTETSRGFLSRTIRTVASTALFLSMLNSFALDMDWIPYSGHIAPTLSLIDETLHFGQYWRIFGPDAPTTCTTMFLTGQYDDDKDGDGGVRKDLLAAIRTHDWSNATDMTHAMYEERSETNLLNMSQQFSHWRWESVFTEAPDHILEDPLAPRVVRLRRLILFVCRWANRELEKLNDPRRLASVDLEYAFVDILPPDERDRFERWDESDDVQIVAECCAWGHECCEDRHDDCDSWAWQGRCESHASYMIEECPASCEICDYRRGDRVGANWMGRGEWYPAEVLSVDSDKATVDVQYDDGTVERDVDYDFVAPDTDGIIGKPRLDVSESGDERVGPSTGYGGVDTDTVDASPRDEM